METMDSSAGPTRQQLIAALNAKLFREQNLALGILAGASAALAGALIWMGITVASGMHVGYVALAVGAGVGYAVRYTGKGVTKVFGVVGAVCTLLSCIAGEALAEIQMAASAQQTGFFQVLPLVDPGKLIGSVIENGSPITYLIYAIGIYEGYKFSFRKLTQQEIVEAGLASTAPATMPPPPPT